MGMMRDTDCQEMDIVKEMAEGLGSQGLRVDEILENLGALKAGISEMLAGLQDAPESVRTASFQEIDHAVREYNTMVDKAHDALRWLLIQREACGFRKHRDVSVHYPIPPKLRPPKP